MKFKCLTCNTDFNTTVKSYKNAKKTGCPNCKKLIASKTHTNKIVSEKTRALIGQKAHQRPGSLLNVTGENHPRFKGGYARDQVNRSTKDYLWLNGVKKLCKNTCVLTGTTTNLVCHHLEAWNSCPERRYDITNGVCINKVIHKEFHDLYHYGNNTEAQFAEFCQIKYNVDWYALKIKIYGNHKPSLI